MTSHYHRSKTGSGPKVMSEAPDSVYALDPSTPLMKQQSNRIPLEHSHSSIDPRRRFETHVPWRTRILDAFNCKRNALSLFHRPATHLACIDGIRALSFLWVLAFMVLFTYFLYGEAHKGGQPEHATFPEAFRAYSTNNPLLGIVANGDMALDAFIVIAGYLVYCCVGFLLMHCCCCAVLQFSVDVLSAARAPHHRRHFRAPFHREPPAAPLASPGLLCRALFAVGVPRSCAAAARCCSNRHFRVYASDCRLLLLFVVCL